MFQAGWFAAVLGAGYGMPWLGVIVVPIVVLIHVIISSDKQAELILILAAGAIGFCVDSLIISAGVFTPLPYLFPRPLSPPWMILLWMNFAITLNVSLKKLHGRYVLSAVLGSVAGPAAYYSGAKLGATSTLPDVSDLLALSVVWAAAVPGLFRIAASINKNRSKRD